MTISIPDTLTIENSGKYIMSIRLRSDGLSFSGYNPSLPGSFFYREAQFDKADPLADSVKEIFYAHDFFTWTYKQVRIVIESFQYTFVPGNIYDEKRKQELLGFVFSQIRGQVFCYEWKDKVCLYQADPEVCEFFSRSFVNPSFIPHILPLIVLGERESKISLPARMYVVLHKEIMDVFCFRQGNLCLVNSFKVSRPEDILYYILYVWKQLGLDQEKDMLFINSPIDLRSRLMDMLHIYLRNISPMEIPSEAYLLGKEIVQAPMDIMALSICEL